MYLIRKFGFHFTKFFLGCLMLFSLTISAQEFELIAKIDTTAKIANLDNFGNLFIITPKNEVLKFSSTGKFLWNYTNKTYGEIGQLDVTDPLRVILYYPGFQQIVVLNNNLSEISKFSFNEQPEVQINLIASANNNGFWVYDQINRELIKLTNYFVDDLKSGNLYQRNGLDMQANYMITDDQYVYINDTIAGIRIFDRFGNFIKTAAINPEKDFEVNGDEIYYMQQDSLMSYNYLNFEFHKIVLPTMEPFQNALLRFNRLVILREKDLTLWAVKKN